MHANASLGSCHADRPALSRLAPPCRRDSGDNKDLPWYFFRRAVLSFTLPMLVQNRSTIEAGASLFGSALGRGAEG